jgi:hypothetical protein
VNETAERLYREARAMLGLGEQSNNPQNSSQNDAPSSPRSVESDPNECQIEEIEVQNSP